MSEFKIRTGPVDDFFKRGKAIAKKADAGEALKEEATLTFEDPDDVLELLTPARLKVFREVKDAPGSIQDVASRLHRHRAAVSRDIDQLQKAGLIKVSVIPSPGHGQKKWLEAAAKSFRLEALIA